MGYHHLSCYREQDVDPIGNTLLVLYTVGDQTTCNMQRNMPAPVTPPSKHKAYHYHTYLLASMSLLKMHMVPSYLLANAKSRGGKGKGGPAKMDSIKHKFYCWFSDFEQRFGNNSNDFTFSLTLQRRVRRKRRHTWRS